MNQTYTTSIDQKAFVHSFQGRGQVVRDGFYLPVEVGMELQPGDRISAYEDSRAEVSFTGVSTKLVLANGSAATLNMQVTDPAQGPQWVASNLYGTKVFFEEGVSPVQLAATNAVSMPAEEAKPNPEAKPQVDLDTPGSSSMMGLFSYEKGQGTQAGKGEPSSTFPVMETVAGVAGVALLAGGVSSDEDDDTTLTTAAEAGFSDGSTASGGTASSGSGSNMGTGGTAGQGGEPATDTPNDMPTDTPSDNPLDMLLAATPLGDALAPITSVASAAGLETLTGLLPI
ncbi:MAG: hypothetical protein QE278_10450 [Limnobacter sp.]|nr:hypothetical protein [Limnobacter sp.]